MYSEERVYLSVHLLFPQVLPSPSTSPSVTDFTIRNSFRSTALYKYRMTKATDDDSNNNAENFYDDDNKMATMTRQRQQCSPVHAPRTRIDQRWIVSSTSARLPTCGIAAQWVEWLWNWRVENWAICSSACSFARTAHPFACSALFASLARSAALIRLHANSLTFSRAHGKEI